MMDVKKYENGCCTDEELSLSLWREDPGEPLYTVVDVLAKTEMEFTDQKEELNDPGTFAT